jgi:hypothetical protein
MKALVVIFCLILISCKGKDAVRVYSLYTNPSHPIITPPTTPIIPPPPPPNMDCLGGFNNTVYALANTSDGILIGGSFTSFHGTSISYLTKIDYGCTIDLTFSTPILDGYVSHIEISSTNEIFISGNFSGKIKKLYSNGNEDTNFTANVGSGITGGIINTITTDNSNIYIGGTFTAFQAITVNPIIKLDFNGMLDSTFDANLDIFSGEIKALALNGTILYVGGNFATYNGDSVNGNIQLNDDGSYIGAFAAIEGNDITAITVLDSNSIYLGSSGSQKIYRVDNTGTMYPSFNSPNLDGEVEVIKIDSYSSSNIFLIGSFTNRLIKIDDTGNIDSNFNIGTGLNNTAHDLVLNYPYVYVGGNFSAINNISNTGKGLGRVTFYGDMY